MAKIVTFGEAMVRLSPPGFERIEQASALDMRVGGAELNVVAGAARLGFNAEWVTRLPDNPLGRFVNNQARQFGVDTSRVAWSDAERMGLYFVEFGAAPRATSVLYDRADSAFAGVAPGEFDWDGAFAGADVFHTSGISPALSDSAAEVTVEALRAARRSGATISFDPNYRAKLWSHERAAAVLRPLLEFVDVLVTNRADAESVLGIAADSDIEAAERLAGEYGVGTVAIPSREPVGAGMHRRSGVAFAEGERYASRTYDIEMVDMVGGGDSFAAGFLCGLIEADAEQALEWGVAFAALKHTNPGDLNFATRGELEQLLAGSGMHIGR